MSYEVVERYIKDYKDIPSSLGSLMNHLSTLYELTLEVNAKVVVECGCDSGSSTIALLAACKETGGKVYSCDIVDCKQARKVVKEYDLEQYWTFTIMHDLEYAQIWDKEIDILFIDSDHTYSLTKGELRNWVPFIRKGGYILLHDVVGRKSEVQRAIDEFLETRLDLSYKVAVEDVYGLGLMRKI